MTLSSKTVNSSLQGTTCHSVIMRDWSSRRPSPPRQPRGLLQCNFDQLLEVRWLLKRHLLSRCVRIKNLWKALQISPVQTLQRSLNLVFGCREWGEQTDSRHYCSSLLSTADWRMKGLCWMELYKDLIQQNILKGIFEAKWMRVNGILNS